MNDIEKDLLKRLESMPFEEARTTHTRLFRYLFDSPNHEFCLLWLRNKESEFMESREERTLSIAKEANAIRNLTSAAENFGNGA